MGQDIVDQTRKRERWFQAGRYDVVEQGTTPVNAALAQHRSLRDPCFDTAMDRLVKGPAPAASKICLA